MDTFLQDEVEEQKRNRSEWAKMNAIQRSGFIGFFTLLIAAFIASEAQQPFLELGALTSIFLGWVAGALWKVRHALHFWWSLLLAILTHLLPVPTYLRIIRHFLLTRHPGREVGMVEIGMVAAETVFLILILKRVALWIHTRTRKTSKF